MRKHLVLIYLDATAVQEFHWKNVVKRSPHLTSRYVSSLVNSHCPLAL
jgi:hypothetical protein